MIVLTLLACLAAGDDLRPNILVCIADDWGWPHASSCGDPVVKTPSFDRLAGEGLLFERAFVSSPSCTPSRAALLTGQDFWRLEESANLWSTLRPGFATYPDLLEGAGYHVGFTRKGWGPGRLEPGGRERNPAGPSYGSFEKFLERRPADAPFCFWFGSYDPHRGYEAGSGAASGMDLDRVEVPEYFPDVPEVRADIADYYFEVQRFDTEVGRILQQLEDRGELNRTLVVMTGDHGMPFPRCKGNLYDSGTRVPLVLRWGDRVAPGREVRDFVSLVDLAPTFLEAAGVAIPGSMTGRSLMPLLSGESSGQLDPERDAVVFGRERHVPAQAAPSTEGYPARGLRTDRWLYIRNFEPTRWPAGVPQGATHRIGRFADCDDGPTKRFMMEHASDPRFASRYQLAFGLRPGEELYDLAVDAEQIHDRAGQPAYAEVMASLRERLDRELRRREDPRIQGEGERLEAYPYYGGGRGK